MTSATARIRRIPRNRLTAVAAVILAAILVAGAAFAVRQIFFGPKTITAYFTSATAIYPDDQVRVSGVKVGTIKSIEPQGTKAKMTLHVDRDVPIPADAKAVIVTQNLVAAVATLNLGNIVDAAVDGTKGFVTALGQGAGDIVTGIETAQKTLVTALATRPAAAAAAPAKSLGAVPDLDTKTVTLSTTATRATAPKSTSGAGVAKATKRAHHDNADAKAAK